MSDKKRIAHPASWVPTAYLAEGIPFAMVIWVAGTMFKDLGHSDSEITLATASIGIVWSLKPFWAAFLEMYRTKKFFVLSMEFFMAAVLAVLSLTLRLPNYFQLIIAGLWILGFASATQDICVDGVYITSLDEKQQAGWIGVQGTFWNVGRIFATAAVVALVGLLKNGGRDAKFAWTCGLGLSAAVMAALGIYHYFMLPTGAVIADSPKNASDVAAYFGATLRDFFKKPSIVGMLIFVFLYRTGEGFLLIEAPLFLQAQLKDGGVGLTLAQKAFVDGTVSTGVSLFAGLLGGAVVARYGLKACMIAMAICMNVPHLCYVYLSHAVSPAAPLSLSTVMLLVSIEKFGYSFGFTANMLYMMQQIAPGKFKMTHYAYCTALMNLVLVPTQAVSGLLADKLGYKNFFLFVLIASIPSIIAAWRAPFPNASGPAEDKALPKVGEPPADIAKAG